MRKKEDLRIVKTRASLYRSLMKLMKNKSFEEIKISEICKESLINRSTFYDHFNDKYELLNSLINDLKNDLNQALIIDNNKKSIKEYAEELFKALLNHIDQNKEVYSTVIKVNGNSAAKDMTTEAIIEAVTKELEERYNNKLSISSKTFILFYASGFINVIFEALKDIDTFNKDELYNTIIRLLNNIEAIK